MVVFLGLEKYFKVKNVQLDKEESTYKKFDTLESDVVRAYKESTYAKERYGFLPISVWYVKKGKWRKLIEEYSKYVQVKQRDIGVRATPHGGRKKGNIRFSLRNPTIDERIYKIYGFRDAQVYSPFMGHTIEYIIAGQMGMNYWGSTVNQYIVNINRRFYEEHKHLVPSDIVCKFWVEDATVMESVDNNSVDLIWTSPPYWRAEQYPSDHPNEMSRTETYDEFLELYRLSAKQIYRVLKPNRYAILQVGDVRFEDVFYSLGADTLFIFREAGFKIHDVIVMINISPHAWVAGGRAIEKKYTIKTHEYLLVFLKQ